MPEALVFDNDIHTSLEAQRRGCECLNVNAGRNLSVERTIGYLETSFLPRRVHIAAEGAEIRQNGARGQRQPASTDAATAMRTARGKAVTVATAQVATMSGRPNRSAAGRAWMGHGSEE